MEKQVFSSGETILKFAGTSGAIEGALQLPQQAREDVVAVVCHPHPLFGGTMQNKVVSTVVRACNELSIASIRFNFRGVGASNGTFDNGVGESDDLRAVIAWTTEHFPHAKIVLAGFSFGSYVAYRTAAQAQPMMLICIAPPVKNFSFDELPEPICPWLVIQNQDDDVVAFSEVDRFVQSRTHQPQFIVNPDGGHFFHGKLVELRTTLMNFISQHASILKAGHQ